MNSSSVYLHKRVLLKTGCFFQKIEKIAYLCAAYLNCIQQ